MFEVVDEGQARPGANWVLGDLWGVDAPQPAPLSVIKDCVAVVDIW